MKQSQFEIAVFFVVLVLLIGTVFSGGYAMYRINTTDFKGIIGGLK